MNSGASSSTPSAIQSPGRRSSPGPMTWAGPATRPLTTDAQGRFTWRLPAGTELVSLVAYKDGLTALGRRLPRVFRDPPRLKLRLAKPAPFAAVLVDSAGKPVCRVRGQGRDDRRTPFRTGTTVSACVEHIRREVIADSPIEPFFVTATDAAGAFSFWVFAAEVGAETGDDLCRGPRADPVPAGGRRTEGRMMEDPGFVPSRPGAGPARCDPRRPSRWPEHDQAARCGACPG